MQSRFEIKLKIVWRPSFEGQISSCVKSKCEDSSDKPFELKSDSDRKLKIKIGLGSNLAPKNVSYLHLV